MKALACEMCGSQDMVKQDGMYVCQYCGTKYSVEEAKKMMIEGTVDIQGTVKVDNTVFVEKYLENARRAYAKEDWEEVEKYYNMVEQNAPSNMEAVFFSAYGKAMLSLVDSDYYKRQQKFKVLNNSISVINDYFEITNEDKKMVLEKIRDAIKEMFIIDYVYNPKAGSDVGGFLWQRNLLLSTRDAFVVELKQIAEKHNDSYINELIKDVSEIEFKHGCYIATAVYGSYDCPEVWTLRRFRDFTLAKSVFGRLFICTYYAISPTLVKWFGETNWFKNLWKPTLDKIVARLNEKGVENTPYDDIVW